MLKDLSEEIKKAMRSGDRLRVSVLRLLSATIRNREIERGKDYRLSESEILEVVVGAVKQRRESIEGFERGGRDDLVHNEQEELKVLQEYLPPQMTQEELDAVIREVIQSTEASSLKDMGRVMKTLIPQIRGRADSGQVSQKVKQLLSVQS